MPLAKVDTGMCRSHPAAGSAVPVRGPASPLASTATGGEQGGCPPLLGRLELREFLACPCLGRAAQQSLGEVPEVICPDDSASWLPGFVFWF